MAAVLDDEKLRSRDLRRHFLEQGGRDQWILSAANEERGAADVGEPWPTVGTPEGRTLLTQEGLAAHPLGHRPENRGESPVCEPLGMYEQGREQPNLAGATFAPSCGGLRRCLLPFVFRPRHRIEERELGHPLGCPAHDLERHIAAEREPSHGKSLRQSCQRARRHGRNAVVAGQIRHPHISEVGKSRDLMAPKRGIAERARKQDERLTAPAKAGRYHPQGDCGKCIAQDKLRQWLVFIGNNS